MTSRLFLLPAFVIALVPGLVLAQSAPAASAPVAAVAASSSAPSPAQPALALPAPPSAIQASVVTPAVPANDSLGSTQLRESTHIKAMIDLEKLKASLEEAQHSRLLAQKKFAEDLQKESDSEKSVKDDKADKTVVAAPVLAPQPKPYATSYYDFNGQSFARLVFQGAQFVVSPGTALPDGAKVQSISPTRVVLTQHGQRVNVPYVGGGLGSGE